MISITNALLKIREIISESKNKTICETVQLNNAYGRILCENVESTYNFPPFNASTKHGYAVLVTDGKCLRKVLQQNKENTVSCIRLMYIRICNKLELRNKTFSVLSDVA